MSRTRETQMVQVEVEVLRCDGCGAAVVGEYCESSPGVVSHAERPKEWFVVAQSGASALIEVCSSPCLEAALSRLVV